jgi:hypothetical protein
MPSFMATVARQGRREPPAPGFRLSLIRERGSRVSICAGGRHRVAGRRQDRPARWTGLLDWNTSGITTFPSPSTSSQSATSFDYGFAPNIVGGVVAADIGLSR